MLYRGADILILDEPTAVLTPQETEGFFRTLKEMTSLAGFKDTSQFWSDPAKLQPPPPDNKPDINEQLVVELYSK